MDEIERRQEELAKDVAAREGSAVDDESAEDGHREDGHGELEHGENERSQHDVRPAGGEWKKKNIWYNVALDPEKYTEPVPARKELLKSGLPGHIITKINRLDFEDTIAGGHPRKDPTHRKINEDANKKTVTICWMSQQYPLEGNYSTTPAPGVECEMCVHRREAGEEVACFYFASSKLIHLAV